MRTLKSTTTSTSTAMVVDLGSAPPAAVAMHRSPRHSPVPYLFGGLAAMLGLIAFALLVLACSYWKLSGQLNGDNNGGEDLETGDDDDDLKKCNKDRKGSVVYEEQFVVIMAGDHKPTCLAMPVVVCSRSSSAKLFNLSDDDKASASASAAAAEERIQSDKEAESTTNCNMNSE